MSRDLRVSMERKPVDTGAVWTREPWRLVFSAKARANAPDLVAGPLPEGEALLHRGRHGAGELRGGLAQGIIPGGHGGLHIPTATLVEHTLLLQRFTGA